MGIFGKPVASVVKLYEVLKSSKYVVMVQEYCELGSILSYMRQKTEKRLPEPEARHLFKQIVTVFAEIH